jgi:hypothetical protein
MKPPKYSPRVSLNLYAEIGEDHVRRSKAVRNRAQSMPPLGPLPDLFRKTHSTTILHHVLPAILIAIRMHGFLKVSSFSVMRRFITD